MLSVDNRLDPLLKRPFSIHRWINGDIQFLYRVVGKGTNILSERKPGDTIEGLGPLGNGFPAAQKNSRVILAAGGMGIAPIFNLAEKLRERKPLLLYGSRTKREILLHDEFSAMGIEPLIATDDGSLGKKGNIVNVLNRLLSEEPSSVKNLLIYACGPEPMLKALAGLAEKRKIKGYVALEQYMACGIGTCLGCAVKTRAGYKRVCKEGPVFKIDDIVWD